MNKIEESSRNPMQSPRFKEQPYLMVHNGSETHDAHMDIICGISEIQLRVRGFHTGDAFLGGGRACHEHRLAPPSGQGAAAAVQGAVVHMIRGIRTGSAAIQLLISGRRKIVYKIYTGSCWEEVGRVNIVTAWPAEWRTGNRWGHLNPCAPRSRTLAPICKNSRMKQMSSIEEGRTAAVSYSLDVVGS